ncbi:MAG: hypothetical protein DRQ65_03165 [Gammaproteobacteria bacterium]|nr:MAG: hypothetical protein DRQ65_03165 [Gammaproteobacteria bacterium]
MIMIMIRRYAMLAPLKPLLALILLLVATACAQAPVVQQQPAAEFAAEGLHPVSSSGFAAAYARPDARLSTYRTVNIEVLELGNIDISRTPVAGTLRRDWQMTPDREVALQQVWARAMDRSFSGYQRASSGDNTLRIAARMTGIAPGRPTATTVGGGLQSMASSQDVVEVSMEFRLYNQAGGELLAVIRDSRTMVSVAMSRTTPVAVQTMFNSWAALLHTRVSGK